jgi:signal peptidase I
MGRDTRSGSRRDDKGRTASRGRTILEYIVLAVVAVAVALLIQAFLVKPYRIPSASMENTLLIGDRVLVDRISWRFSQPERGDIVVFHPPVGGSVLIKRIIGLPNDEISLRGGFVYINGRRLDEPYVRRVDGRQEPSEPFSNGLPWSLQEPYKAPGGSYFVMGDNRSNSGDSREFGPIKRAQFVGRAFARYWPPGRIGGID